MWSKAEGTSVTPSDELLLYRPDRPKINRGKGHETFVIWVGPYKI